ncbi:uncharacterized protein ASCRUDRAFT_133089 [Ascoidea rubescens DSM 1968]|uniref:Secreted protein n=1 Tax=Ascoidea rubescens DSM 1968 TaxID=1344418 RepID=A0A1D2VKW0_9ASCO|nr:hypothetical protein ASCRUDRAFT_133089 [Ascoidea rubescens DSM 1968]ODV62218.1 hypothetical protein ASCRUDRAFT_133089 [Ascoidea rubescens DSM 1968]
MALITRSTLFGSYFSFLFAASTSLVSGQRLRAAVREHAPHGTPWVFWKLHNASQQCGCTHIYASRCK